MNDPEVISTKSRSDGAKRMWQRRKEKQKGMQHLPIQVKPTREWMYHVEWLITMSSIIGCFLYCYRESSELNKKIDARVEEINRRTDQIGLEGNRRTDELHKEFYELLREMRNK
jgi:hypothetical protein